MVCLSNQFVYFYVNDQVIRLKKVLLFRFGIVGDLFFLEEADG